MQPDRPSHDGAIHVLYADETLVVLNKPAGLLAVPGRGPDKQDCLSARVQAIYPDALVVHRLDMATSGLVVMARGAPAQRLLSEAFALRQVHKRYVAVVSGQLAPTADGWQTIDLPILVDWPNRPRRMIDWQQGKASVTHWQMTQFDAEHHSSRVELEPVTGRTHQLRVHLQAIGHPILGDALYAPPAVLAQAQRLLLHACALAFAHPVDGRALQFCCPADF